MLFYHIISVKSKLLFRESYILRILDQLCHMRLVPGVQR